MICTKQDHCKVNAIYYNLIPQVGCFIDHKVEIIGCSTFKITKDGWLIQNIGVNVAFGKPQKNTKSKSDWSAIASKIMKFFPFFISKLILPPMNQFFHF